MQAHSTSSFCVDLLPFHIGENMRQFSILVVDDNLINRRLAKLMLETLGHSVDLAKNGREAVRAVQCHSYDVIFMDMHMPIMDGMDATHAIRTMDYPKNCTKIIGFTGDASLTNRDAYMATGIDDIIFKPIDLNIFSEILKKCLGGC